MISLNKHADQSMSRMKIVPNLVAIPELNNLINSQDRINDLKSRLEDLQEEYGDDKYLEEYRKITNKDFGDKTQ